MGVAHLVMFQVALSVLMTAAGVIIAALGDFSFDLFGYSMALTSVFFQVLLSAILILTIPFSWSFSLLLEFVLIINQKCFLTQTMYLVLVERSGAEDGLSSVEIMFYNSFLSLPFLLFLIIATGEFPNSLAILSAKVRIFPHFYHI